METEFTDEIARIKEQQDMLLKQALFHEVCKDVIRVTEVIKKMKGHEGKLLFDSFVGKLILQKYGTLLNATERQVDSGLKPRAALLKLVKVLMKKRIVLTQENSFDWYSLVGDCKQARDIMSYLLGLLIQQRDYLSITIPGELNSDVIALADKIWH